MAVLSREDGLFLASLEPVAAISRGVSPGDRTLLFASGLSALSGAAVLATAATKTGRIEVLVRGVPDVAGIMLALAAAAFVIIGVDFWWQDPKDRR